MNLNNPQNKYSLFREKYDAIEFICSKIFDVVSHSLKTNGYETSLDLKNNFFFKLVGYNGKLIKVFNLIEKYSYLSKIIFIVPFLRFLLRKTFGNQTSHLEFIISEENLCQKESKKKYDSIYFASMNNYLNSFINGIKEEMRSNRNVLLLVPFESRNWLNFQRVTQIEDLDVIFFEEFLGSDIFKDIRILKSILAKIIKDNKRNFINILEYKQIKFGKFYHKILSSFISDFCSFKIIFYKKLNEFLSVCSVKNTKFFIARNRRSLEMAFIQCGNQISGNTTILSHGLLYCNFENTYWGEGSFSDVKNVFVIGEHDKTAIEKRLKLLNLPMPNIYVNGDFLFHETQRELNVIPNVLFCARRPTYKYIPILIKNKPNNCRLIVRLHPSDKKLIPSYTKRYSNSNVSFDPLSEPLVDTLKHKDLCIGHASTSLLESFYAKIPVLILFLKGKVSKYPNIFSENNLKNNDFSLMCIDNKEQIKDKIVQTLKDPTPVLKINKKLFDYFVTIK